MEWISEVPVRHDSRLIHNALTATKGRGNIWDFQGINKFYSGYQVPVNLYG